MRFVVIEPSGDGIIAIEKEIPVKDLKISALVTYPSGGTYRETREWTGLDPAATPMFEETGKKIAAKLLEQKESGPLKVELSSERDGVADPVVQLDDVSYKEQSKFQRFFWELEGKVIAEGEKAADHKDKTHGTKHKGK